MNILLTDLNSLTVDLPQIPATAADGGENFTRLLQQQLPADTESNAQVIEFSDFFEISPGAGEVPVSTAKAAIESWQNYLSQHQIRVTTDSDALAVTLQQPAPGDAAAAPVAGPVSDRATTVADLELPESGKILPPAAGLRMDLALPRIDSMPAPVESLAIAARPVRGMDRAIVTSPLPNLAAPSTAAVEVPGVAPVSTRSPAETEMADARTAVQALPARLAVKPQIRPFATSTTTPVFAAETVLPGEIADTRAEALLRQNTPTIDPLGQASPRQNTSTAVANATESATLLTAKPQVSSPGQMTAALASDGELPSMRETAAPSETHAPGLNRGKTPLPGGAAAVDTGRLNQAGESLVAAAPPARSAAEVLAGGETLIRTAETPATSSGSQPQPVLLPQAAAGVGSNTATQSPMPPHLESLSLARNAEPAAWGEGLGERVSWMVNQKQNSASIRLDPPLLGKLDVQVRLADDATTITIQTQHAQTRDLIETASVRLRDYLQESGFQNVNVDVSQRHDQQQARAQGDLQEEAGEQQDTLSEQESDGRQTESAIYSIGDGLLDTFA